MTTASAIQRLDDRLDGVRVTPGDNEGFPLWLMPETTELKMNLRAAVAWVTSHKDSLDAWLLAYGAIFFRGFPLPDSLAFNEFLSCYPDHDGGYSGGTTQRGAVVGRVMEATVAPSDRFIPMHQEMAYSPRFPSKLAFYCELPPTKGGETPFCDMRRLTHALPGALRDSVRTCGLLYKRHFRNPDYETGVPDLDIVHRTWQEAFQTGDRTEVERQVRLLGSEFEWVDNGLLVWNPSAGFVTHPVTGESVWFNSIGGYGFNRAVLGDKLGALYEQYYDESRPLPMWATYGDGEKIPAATIAPLYRITEQLQSAIPWRQGDVVLLDNILVGHARNPYEGERKIRVSLLA
jgi:alpha-ketoglutarate-dependent taurine dioxygenase